MVFFSFNRVSLTMYSTLLVVIFFLMGISILDLIELKTYDLRFLSRGVREAPPTIVIATIDEKSVDSEGRWPWPRSKIAQLVDALSREGAKVIAFDIGFFEPDGNTRLDLIEQFDKKMAAQHIRDRELADFIAESRITADNDGTLARAIKESSAVIVLGYFFHMSQKTLNYQITPEEIDRRLTCIGPSSYPIIIYQDREAGMEPFIKAYAPEVNIDVLSRATTSAGHFNMLPDRDGVVRWIPLAIACGNHIFPPLSIQSAWNYLDQPQLSVKVPVFGVEGIQMGDRFIPTDENGQILINFMGPPRTVRHYSVTDILRGKLAKGTFRDQIVLVGSTAIGLHDLQTTPFGPLFPGVEIHATIIENIVNQNFITRPKWTRIYDLLAILVLGILAGIGVSRLNAVKGVLFVSGLFTLHIVIALWLFVDFGIWLNLVYPLLALVVAYIAITVFKYFTEERERKRIKGAFSHYVSDAVINEILKDPNKLKLGGEERVVSVLFSDLAGFTTISERTRPRELVSLLNDYFTEMTEQIFTYKGTLAQYVGDEVMAIFGAPVEHAEHAEQACNTALAMRESQERLRRTWAEMGRPLLSARTGINSGPMLVGNLGSVYRFSYGVLGDNVNLASRLEGINKIYGTEIIVGENTARLVDGSFVLRELDRVRVKGKDTAISIYELVARLQDPLPDDKIQLLAAYAEGLSAYRAQQWQEALSLFEQGQAHWPADQASRVMAGRCRAYLEIPPSADWDGVFQMVTK
jgi:adenylate cyclase